MIGWDNAEKSEQTAKARGDSGATLNPHVPRALEWVHGNVYRAQVSVTHSCYVEGDLKVGLPSGTAGVPEIEHPEFTPQISQDDLLSLNVCET